MKSKRTAKLAPAPRAPRSVAEVRAEFDRELKDEFCLDPLPAFAIMVEGKTDVLYLHRAAQLAADEDLLGIPAHLAPDGDRIAILTPGSPVNCSRGGVDRVVELARVIHPYMFKFGLIQGVALVFDYDDAGRGGLRRVEELGYVAGQGSYSLDPTNHPGACGRQNIVIEDLLSLGLQRRFFDFGGAWCSAVFQAGEITRFVWDSPSKGRLCDFACREGEAEDFREVIRLLRRIRKGFGFPTSEVTDSDDAAS